MDPDHCKMAPSNTREGIHLALEASKKCIELAGEAFKQYPFTSLISIVGIPALRNLSSQMLTIVQILCIHLINSFYLRFLHRLSRFPGPFLAPYSNVCNPPSLTNAPDCPDADTQLQGFWYYTILAGRGPWKNHAWHQRWGKFPIPFNDPCSAATFVAFCLTNVEFSVPKAQ
jgi:hypothetical protein